MSNLLFPFLLIFSWSCWSWINLKLTSENYFLEMRLNFDPADSAMGTVEARSANYKHCMGVWAIDAACNVIGAVIEYSFMDNCYRLLRREVAIILRQRREIPFDRSFFSDFYP